MNLYDCNFANKNEVIQERFIVGLQDIRLSQRLQFIPDLKLDNTLEIARTNQRTIVGKADKNRRRDPNERGRSKRKYSQNETIRKNI